MLRRERIALGLLVWLGLIVGLTIYDSSHQPPRNQSNQATEQTPQNRTEHVIAPVSDNERIAGYTHALATWTTVIGLATIWLGLISIGTTIVQSRDMKESLRIAGDASKQTEKALLVSERPWLSADLKMRDDGILVEPSQTRVIVVLELWNWGQSPAVDLEIEINFCPSEVDSRAALRRLCKAARDGDPDRRFRAWEPIFPKNRSDPDPVIAVAVDKDAIRAATQGWAPPLWINPCLIGCITYKSPFSDEKLQTAFIYDLRHLRTDSPNTRYPFEVDAQGNFAVGNVAADRLSLDQSFASGCIT